MRLALVLLPLSTGCFGQSITDFPPGFEPLEDLVIEAPGAPGELPETFALALGTTDDNVHWGHLRGFVHGPIERVWAAYQQPDVIVDRRRVASFTATPDIEPELDFSLAIDQVVRDILTIEYRLVWRHGSAGDPDAPDKVAIRWQKTEGSALIDTLRGSVLLLPTHDPNITEVQSIEHLKAPRTSTDDVEGLLTDVWFDVVAATHGRALPVYED